MHGVVVSTGSMDSGQYRYQILELDVQEGEGPSIIRHIHQSAFKVSGGIVEMAERKNLQRRLDVPLLYGDMISWNERDLDSVGAITAFSRDKAIYNTRSADSACQILLRGVINPDDRLHIVTNIFKKIALPVDQIHVSLPNVFYDCWIEIQLEYDGFLVKFCGFASVCDVATQEDLMTLPWNIENDKYVMRGSMYSDSDDEYSEPASSSNKPPVLEIHGKNAFVSGPRTFFCSEFPNKMFVIPLLKKHDPAAVIGVSLKVDAIWNRFENLYMVTRVQPQKTVPNWPTVGDRIKCSVHSTFTPGVFWNNDLGFVDDPDGKLSLLHLTSYANSGFQVTLVDSRPSKAAEGKLRFRIVDLAPTAKECRIQKFLKTSIEKNKPLLLSNETGIVISNTHLFSAKHPSLIIRLPDGEDAKPGLTAKFTAEYNHTISEFEITEFTYLPDAGLRYAVRRMLKHSPYEEMVLFQVPKARLPDRKDLPRLLHCEQFGYLDDLGLVNNIRRNKDYSVWIMFSRPDYQDAFRPARVPWEIVSTDEEEPRDRVSDGTETVLGSIDATRITSTETQSDSVPVGEPVKNSSTGSRLAVDEYGTDDRYMEPVEPTLPKARPPSVISEPSSTEGSDVDASLVVPVSENRNITVESIIDNLNRIPHADGCGDVCVRNCPFLSHVALHICSSINFWEDVRRFYPDAAKEIRKRMGGA